VVGLLHQIENLDLESLHRLKLLLITTALVLKYIMNLTKSDIYISTCINKFLNKIFKLIQFIKN